MSIKSKMLFKFSSYTKYWLRYDHFCIFCLLLFMHAEFFKYSLWKFEIKSTHAALFQWCGRCLQSWFFFIWPKDSGHRCGVHSTLLLVSGFWLYTLSYTKWCHDEASFIHSHFTTCWDILQCIGLYNEKSCIEQAPKSPSLHLDVQLLFVQRRIISLTVGVSL